MVWALGRFHNCFSFNFDRERKRHSVPCLRYSTPVPHDLPVDDSDDGTLRLQRYDELEGLLRALYEATNTRDDRAAHGAPPGPDRDGPLAVQGPARK